MADQTLEAQHKKRSMQSLLTTDGWKYALDVLSHRLKLHEQMALNPEWPTERRLDAMARKGELVTLMQTLYRMAELPSPLEEHFLAFLGNIKLPEAAHVDVARDPMITHFEDEVARQQRRKPAGSVA